MSSATNAGDSCWTATKQLPRFQVTGTDLEVRDVIELGKKRKETWSAPKETNLESVEAQIRDLHEELRKKHPEATLMVLRDGENGFAGWTDTFISSHGPDGPNDWRTFSRRANITSPARVIGSETTCRRPSWSVRYSMRTSSGSRPLASKSKWPLDSC